MNKRSIYANPLLDYLLVKYDLKNDSALCRLLKIAPPMVSKIRHGRTVSADLILTIHERLGMPVAEIRALLPAKESA